MPIFHHLCNCILKTEGYSLSKTREADIEAMILGIVGNCRVDPKRLFNEDDKLRLLSEKAPDENGLYECEDCHQHFRAKELTVDHIRPWSLGGRTELSNAQLLCRACNSRKNNKLYRQEYEAFIVIDCADIRNV